VCIEPWCGVTDGVDATGNLADKEGIVVLEAGGTFERSFAVTLHL
jgi:hypothetical protein